MNGGHGGMQRPRASQSGSSIGLCIKPTNREAHLSFVDPDEARMGATASVASRASHDKRIPLGTSGVHTDVRILDFK